MIRLFTVVPAALVLCASLGTASYATVVGCDATQVTGVTINKGCHIGVAQVGGMSGNDSAATMNADMVFNQTGWVEIGRDNNVADAINPSSLFSASGTLAGGTLTLDASLFSTYGTIAAVLKAGNKKTGGWIAYDLVASGPYSYQSVFPDGGTGTKDISHLTLYGAGTPILPPPPNPNAPPVPLPASGLLLLAALAGAGAMARRRR